MSEFLKRMKSRSERKNTALARLAKEHTRAKMEAATIWNKAVKDAKKQAKITNAMTTTLANVFCNYTLRRYMMFSSNKCAEFMKHYQHKSECIEKGYTSYDDIERHEIKSTEREYYPIKWTDYAPYNLVKNKLENHMEKAKTNTEFYDKYLHALKISYGNDIFGARELLYLSVLHQYYGIGLKRCKEFVNSFRHLQFSSAKEVWDMVAWLERHKLGFDERDMEYFLQYEDEWISVLKPKTMEAV